MRSINNKYNHVRNYQAQCSFTKVNTAFRIEEVDTSFKEFGMTWNKKHKKNVYRKPHGIIWIFSECKKYWCAKSMYRKDEKCCLLCLYFFQMLINSVRVPNIILNNGEEFIFVQKTAKIILVTCKSNLLFLCNETELIVADGTLTNCSKHFYQQYTIWYTLCNESTLCVANLI